MATSLTDGANSEYINAQNFLRGINTPPEVYVYVEGMDDIAFWSYCLYPFMYNYRFVVTQMKNEQGKESVVDGKTKLIKTIGLDSLGQFKLVAVDADYDWIIEEYRPWNRCESFSRAIRENPYILHTYLYSIENFKCHPDCLSMMLVKATGCTHCFDFKMYMSVLSESLAELFLIHIASIHKCDDIFPLSGFRQLAGDLNVDFGLMQLDSKSQRIVSNKIEALNDYRNSNLDLISFYREKLLTLGFSPKEYYMLFQGHIVANSFVKKRLVTLTQGLRIEEVRKLWENKDYEQGCNRLLHYEKITGIGSENDVEEIKSRIDQLISDSLDLEKSPFGYDRIKVDLDKLFG